MHQSSTSQTAAGPKTCCTLKFGADVRAEDIELVNHDDDHWYPPRGGRKCCSLGLQLSN